MSVDGKILICGVWHPPPPAEGWDAAPADGGFLGIVWKVKGVPWEKGIDINPSQSTELVGRIQANMAS